MFTVPEENEVVLPDLNEQSLEENNNSEVVLLDLNEEQNNSEVVLPGLNDEQSRLLQYLASARKDPFNLKNPGDPELHLEELTDDDLRTGNIMYKK